MNRELNGRTKLTNDVSAGEWEMLDDGSEGRIYYHTSGAEVEVSFSTQWKDEVTFTCLSRVGPLPEDNWELGIADKIGAYVVPKLAKEMEADNESRE